MKKLRLFKISQNVATGYDTYDSAVVCAWDEVDAAMFHPHQGYADEVGNFNNSWHDWADRVSQVEVTLIGKASPTTPRGVVLSSFNAG